MQPNPSGKLPENQLERSSQQSEVNIKRHFNTNTVLLSQSGFANVCENICRGKIIVSILFRKLKNEIAFL